MLSRLSSCCAPFPTINSSCSPSELTWVSACLSLAPGRLILERLAANYLRAQIIPGALLDAVVRLPFRIMLTTAQDNLRQRAFTAVGQPDQEWKDKRVEIGDFSSF